MNTAARSDFGQRRERDYWRTVNRLLIFLIGVGGLVVTFLFFYPELRRIDAMGDDLTQLQKQNTDEALLLRQQQREVEWLNNDPAYVELIARDKLSVMKEGETVFRLDSETPLEPENHQPEHQQ